MSYNGARQKRATSVEEMVASTPRTRVRTEAKADEFANIKDNMFFAITFNESLSPSQKKSELMKALVVTKNKAEDKARVAEFEQFKEFLQANREQMASEIIALTNTETFSQLKSVYEDMNGGLLDFEEKMRPLTEILEAVYKLRQDGATLDVFRSITDDRKKAIELNTQRAGLEDEVYDIEYEIKTLAEQCARLAEEKSFFGFGGVKQAAREEIAVKTAKIEDLTKRQDELNSQIVNLRRQVDELSSSGEYVEEKANLRKLLDISSDEHRENQKALVAAATNFVQTSKERIGEVRAHLGDMSSKIDNLQDSNQTLTRIYAIMNEASKGAAEENAKILADIEAQTPEDLVEKMKVDEEKMAVQDYVKLLNESAVDTMTTYGDLTSEAIQIKSMKDNNQDQVNRAKTMHTQGVAGVASKLSVVLQAVSQAALGESSEMAKSTLHEMSRQTTDIAKKEVIRAAMGSAATNAELERAVENLASFGDTISKSTEVTRQNLEDMRNLFGELEKVAGDVQKDIKDAHAVHAEGTNKPARVDAKVNVTGLGKV